MEKTMLQEVMIHPYEIIFKEVPVPEIRANEVLIRMKYIGICGSDIHVYHGKHPFTSYPITQGHEVSGEVVALGKDVQDLSIGDKVTIEPQIVCGTCYSCRHGKYNLCENLKVRGFQATGAASTYYAIERERVTRLPSSMDYKDGAMMEPLSVAVHAINRAGNVRDKAISIIGAGPIGNLVAQVAKAKGAGKVMVSDVSDYRLSLAKACGIDYVANTKEVNYGDALVAAFGSDKADVIFDCAGNDITMGGAIAYARKGSTIILVAVYAGMAHVDLAVLNDHELDLNTTMMYRHEDYLEAIDLVDQGLIHLKDLQSKVFPFRKYLDAYQYIDNNREKTMKVFIDVEDQD